jgi:hypothetical protein
LIPRPLRCRRSRSLQCARRTRRGRQSRVLGDFGSGACPPTLRATAADHMRGRRRRVARGFRPSCLNSDGINVAWPPLRSYIPLSAAAAVAQLPNAKAISAKAIDPDQGRIIHQPRKGKHEYE